MSLDDDLPPRIAHQRDMDAAQPEWVRMALRQREEAREEAKRRADELAAIEEHETSGDAWLAVFAAQAKDTAMSQEWYPTDRRGIDRRMFGGQVVS